MALKLACLVLKMWSVVQDTALMHSTLPFFPSRVAYRGTGRRVDSMLWEQNAEEGYPIYSPGDQERHLLPNYEVQEVPITASNLCYNLSELCPVIKN